VDNVTNFPTEKRDLIAEMKGPENSGCAVIMESRLIPHVAMYDRGDEIEFVLDGRLAYGFPRDQAWSAMAFAAAAMAIGAGFPHYSGGKHATQREFAPQVMQLDADTNGYSE
jgi:hypothetical protein